MDVIAVNSSPNKDQGNTALILRPFLEGLKEAGIESEVFYPADMDIAPCQGDWDCWRSGSGTCRQDDDMAPLLKRIDRAEIVVLATPLYAGGVNGPMKNFMDRMTPRSNPFFEIRDEHCRHPARTFGQPAKFVLVSTCTFWELDNFNPMVAHIRNFCDNCGHELAGALLRPHAEALAEMLRLRQPVMDVLESAREAGRELGIAGTIDPATMSKVTRQLLPRDAYALIAQGRYEQAIDSIG
jgi:multimeric flavodoxin WrbA